METVKDAANVVRVFRQVDMDRRNIAQWLCKQGGVYGRRTRRLPSCGGARYVAAAGCWARRQWDGSNGVCRDVGPHTVSEHGQQSSF